MTMVYLGFNLRITHGRSQWSFAKWNFSQPGWTAKKALINFPGLRLCATVFPGFRHFAACFSKHGTCQMEATS